MRWPDDESADADDASHDDIATIASRPRERVRIDNHVALEPPRSHPILERIQPLDRQLVIGNDSFVAKSDVTQPQEHDDLDVDANRLLSALQSTKTLY